MYRARIKSRRNRACWLVLLAVAPLALLGCEVEEDDLLLVGTVERMLVDLVAPTSEAIVALEVERGQRVEKDQILVRLDKTFAMADVARADANLVGARAGAMVAKQELRRLREMRSKGVASEQGLERAGLAKDEAEARLREAEMLLLAARKREDDLQLRSPVEGVVDQLPFQTGERIAAGAVLAVVMSDEQPWVRVWVPESSFVRVLPGTPAEIAIDGFEGKLKGRVLDVARESEFTPHYALTERDRVHLVYETRIQLEDAPASLRPGLPAEVRILAPKAVLRAPP